MENNNILGIEKFEIEHNGRKMGSNYKDINKMFLVLSVLKMHKKRFITCDIEMDFGQHMKRIDQTRKNYDNKNEIKINNLFCNNSFSRMHFC